MTSRLAFLGQEASTIITLKYLLLFSSFSLSSHCICFCLIEKLNIQKLWMKGGVGVFCSASKKDPVY